MVVLIVFGILAIVGVIGLYLRDSITSRRISHEGSEFLQTYDAPPRDRSDD